MKHLITKWLLAVWISTGLMACNSINDIQPPDSDSVLLGATQAIKNKYPQAINIHFKTLIKDQLWKATFSQHTIAYQTQVNATGITSSVFKELDNDFTLYKGYTDQLTIKGGEFSNLLAVDDDTSSSRFMTYTFQGVPYQLTYKTGTTQQPRINLTPMPLYYLTNRQELPQRVQAFLATNNGTLGFQSGTVIQQVDSTLTYWVKAAYTVGPAAPALISLFFDGNGNLIWIACNEMTNPVTYTTNSQVGSTSILSATKANYPGFDSPVTLAFETYYQGLVSVRYAFKRVTTTTTEAWDVGLRWPGGQLVYALYQAD